MGFPNARLMPRLKKGSYAITTLAEKKVTPKQGGTLTQEDDQLELDKIIFNPHDYTLDAIERLIKVAWSIAVGYSS